MSKRSSSGSMYSYVIPLVLIVALCLVPELCFADVQGSLNGLRDKLTHIILPVLSVIGLAIAAISFFTGNPQSKQHIVYAILGCIFGFGSQAIVDLIRQTVN